MKWLFLMTPKLAIPNLDVFGWGAFGWRGKAEFSIRRIRVGCEVEFRNCGLLQGVFFLICFQILIQARRSDVVFPSS